MTYVRAVSPMVAVRETHENTTQRFDVPWFTQDTRKRQTFYFILFYFGSRVKGWKLELFPECRMFTECSLNVRWMFPECSLNVPWMFPETVGGGINPASVTSGKLWHKLLPCKFTTMSHQFHTNFTPTSDQIYTTQRNAPLKPYGKWLFICYCCVTSSVTSSNAIVCLGGETSTAYNRTQPFIEAF
jgi:hypothetical protein